MSESISDDRARRALALAGRDPKTPLRRAVAASNDVWIADDFVLRVHARPDLGRFAHEAKIGAAVTPGARYPGVLGHGSDGEIEWMVVPRVPGVELARAWPDLSPALRERATRELATCLAAIHSTEPTGLPVDGDLLAPHVLPLDKLEALIARVADLPGIDAGMMRDVLELVRSTWSAFDDAGRGLVHGDPHLDNVLWHDGHVSAVLDLECGRVSWVEADLEILLAVCDAPWWFVAVELEATARAKDYADVPEWLAAAYPAWFSHPRLRDRLCVLALSRQLGHFEDAPPQGPRDPTDPRDRRNQLAAVLDGLSYVHRLLPG